MSTAIDLPMEFFSIMCRKWAGAILGQLVPGPVRFGDLARAIPGLSRRVMAAELRRLVERRVVGREELPGRRRRVWYALTPTGRTLCAFLRRLRRWDERHLGPNLRLPSAERGYPKVTY